jgi:starvation-inducible outer membrane lipoprotein
MITYHKFCIIFVCDEKSLLISLVLILSGCKSLGGPIEDALKSPKSKIQSLRKILKP